MAAWPATLPVISTLEGYGFEPQDGTVRTEMEAGVPRARRRYSQTVAQYSLSVPLTPAQLGVFESFHQYTAGGGAVWFDMPLVNGLGTTVCQALFAGPFKPRRTSDTMWTVDFQLIVRNRPVAAP